MGCSVLLLLFSPLGASPTSGLPFWVGIRSGGRQGAGILVGGKL